MNARNETMGLALIGLLVMPLGACSVRTTGEPALVSVSSNGGSECCATTPVQLSDLDGASAWTTEQNPFLETVAWPAEDGLGEFSPAWADLDNDLMPCPGAEDETAFFEIADPGVNDQTTLNLGLDAGEFATLEASALGAFGDSTADESQFFEGSGYLMDAADTQIAALFEESWDESRFFEIGDDTDPGTTAVADARRDEDYSDSW